MLCYRELSPAHKRAGKIYKRNNKQAICLYIALLMLLAVHATLLMLLAVHATLLMLVAVHATLLMLLAVHATLLMLLAVHATLLMLLFVIFSSVHNNIYRWRYIMRKMHVFAAVALMLAAAFGTAAFMRADSPTVLMNAMFALAGIAWATINVNSFPMVVELAGGGNVGKFTGYYYTATQAASITGPILCGLVIGLFHDDYNYMFLYCAIMFAIGLIAMIGVKHGESSDITEEDIKQARMADD